MTTHYSVTWTDAKAAEAAATKRGWTADNGTSFWDWIRSEDYETSVLRSTFAGAVRAARNALPFDCFGETMVTRMVSVNHSWGTEFERDASWLIYGEQSEPIEADPDARYELYDEEAA